MSLQVNFNTHGHDLKAAYEAVLSPSDPKNGDNWVVFGYDKGSNDLKVLNQGNGGLDELQEEFVDGKIQYAFARVVDPYSQLNKFVLVGWCGDGVPESKKGLFNSHLNDVSRFLKGFHLQINARCEADVTPALIMRKLDEGSGSKYSTHKESYQAEKIQPLQSAYKRTEIPDITALQRNPTKPEPAPKYNIGGTKPLGFSASAASTASLSSSSAHNAPTKLQDRVWPPPASSSSSSAPSPPASNPAPERSWKTSGGGSSYSASATTSSFNKVQPPASLSSYGQSSPEPVVNKAHQIRLEREAREKEERERIKREIAASEARDRSSESTSTSQRLAEERRLQEKKERERELEREQPQEPVRNVGFNRVREERLAREKEERERAEAEDSARAAREAAKNREQESLRENAANREEEQRRQLEQQQKREREAREEEDRRAREQEDIRRQQEEEEEENQRRQQEEDSRRKQQEEDSRRKQDEEALKRREREEADRKRQQEEEERRRYEEEQEEERRRQEAEDQERHAAAAAAAVVVPAAVVSSSNHAHADEHDGSVSAVVLYSYEKSEENEMSLFEGEIIINVTELDVGWWSGESEDGTRSGLFPANYVEVIEMAQGQQTASHDAPAEQEYHQEEAPVHYEEQGHEAAQTPSQGPSAVALYDYQAGEPNEISFSEGEEITAIDFVTEDWWSGTNSAGAKGLFPANYVERTS